MYISCMVDKALLLLKQTNTNAAEKVIKQMDFQQLIDFCKEGNKNNLHRVLKGRTDCSFDLYQMPSFILVVKSEMLIDKIICSLDFHTGRFVSRMSGKEMKITPEHHFSVQCTIIKGRLQYSCCVGTQKELMSFLNQI